MPRMDVAAMAFSRVYPLLVAKAERKGRTRQEVDTLICWMTGYDEAGLAAVLEQNLDYRAFFGNAPAMNPMCEKISGTICGVKIDAIEDPLMKDIRRLDKLIDELAAGKSLDKIMSRSQQHGKK